MNIYKSLIVICLSAEIGTSCGGTAIGNGNNVQIDENKDVPVVLQAAALTCSVISEARTGIASSTVGCNLVDSEEKRIDTEANKISLSYSVANPSDLVEVKLAPQIFKGHLYHATAVLKAQDPLVVISYAATFKLSAVASFGEGKSKTFASANPKKFSPSVSADNWSVGNTGSERYAIDLQTGLKWRPFTGEENTWEGGSQSCADSSYAGITTWRLPELSEFYTAAGNGIYANETTNTIGFISYGHVFWANIPPEVKLPAGAIEEANLYDFTKGLDQTIVRHDIGSRQPTICVAD